MTSVESRANTTAPAHIVLREVRASDLPVFFEQQLDPIAQHMVAFTCRDPADRVALSHATDPPASGGLGELRGAVPWPGQVPAPAPAIVYAEPVPAEVVDATGATVSVDGRGLLGPRPSRVRAQGRDWSTITAWAGPWLVDERWWDPAAHRRLVRLQATTDQGAAYLLRLTGGRWWVEAIYD